MAVDIPVRLGQGRWWRRAIIALVDAPALHLPRVPRPSAGWLALSLVLCAGCGAPGPTPQAVFTGTPGPTGQSASPSAPSVPPSPTAPALGPPDLTARPLVWFAPLPPLPTGPGRPYTGSDDFMQLFAPGAPWDRAAAHVQAFKLYGEWVAYDATEEELRTALAAIASRGMTMAVEMGPLDANDACGQGVESFAGIQEGELISRRIRDAGGVLQVIAMDEPYFFAHVYDGPNACHWPIDRVGAGVAAFIRAMRAEWPGLVVGDTEPMPAPVSAAGLAEWLDAYRAATGEAAAFLHLDMDWSRGDWPALGAAVRKAGAKRGVAVGMIYNGGAATTDAQWVAIAGQRVLADERASGGAPDHVLFQSWMDKPDHVLPESDPATFTGLVDRYFDDHAALGQVQGGPVNLALGRHATSSSSIAGSGAGKAVDGDPDTLWSAGTGPPSWIQVDLGRAVRISTIRLTVSQYPDGRTRHRVTCATSAGGARRLLATLAGSTHDGDVLTVALDSPISCRLVRIETLTSLSWVAWREIEVIGAP